MLVTRFDPFKEIINMQKMFNNYPAQASEETNISTFTPNVNTREGEFAYHIEVDLPGIDKKDINIDIDDGKLTISGKREFKEEVKEKDYFKMESYFGTLQRSFTIPKNVDVENITASCANGVLEVVIPKLEQNSNKKTIQIQ